jgi:hypothetical protein
LVCHAVVKRAYVELRERVDSLKRLAFYTITEESAAKSESIHWTGSRPEDIDVLTTVGDVDLENQYRALDCYVTYRATIEEAGIRNSLSSEAVFEIYQEAHEPRLSSLFEELTEG